MRRKRLLLLSLRKMPEQIKNKTEKCGFYCHFLHSFVFFPDIFCYIVTK